MPSHRIAVIGGDGIGPEVIEHAVRAAERAAANHDKAELAWTKLPWSTTYYKQHGRMLPADGWEILQGYEAILFGAVGSPDVPDRITVHELLLPMRRRRLKRSKARSKQVDIASFCSTLIHSFQRGSSIRR